MQKLLLVTKYLLSCVILILFLIDVITGTSTYGNVILVILIITLVISAIKESSEDGSALWLSLYVAAATALTILTVIK